MIRMDDAEIIKRAQAGDRLAFGTLFDAYYPGVYRYLNERLGGAPEAEDLCQEVFLAVLGSIDEYPVDGSLSFDEWLVRVAHRMASEHSRGRSRRQGRQAEPDRPQSGCLNPAALALLPAHQRQVVACRYQSGLSMRQTATALGLDMALVHRIERAAFETWLQCDSARGDG